MLEQLRKVAQLKISQANNLEEKQKYEIIEKILAENDCFQKMQTEIAYNLLLDLGFSNEEVKKIYNEIIFSSLGF